MQTSEVFKDHVVSSHEYKRKFEMAETKVACVHLIQFFSVKQAENSSGKRRKGAGGNGAGNLTQHHQRIWRREGCVCVSVSVCLCVINSRPESEIAKYPEDFLFFSSSSLSSSFFFLRYNLQG
jgi:hypothetical protein